MILIPLSSRHGRHPAADGAAIEARQALAADLRRMTPEERLAAYVRHCQLMAQIRLAGETGFRATSPKPVADAH